MGDPRNPARADELWDPHRLEVMDLEIQTFLAGFGTLSGGWAWHYMSPPHEELKLHHDHKDVDIFVKPNWASTFIYELKQQGYTRTWTQYDDPSGQFTRYERHIEEVKIIIDLFVEDVPEVRAGPVLVDINYTIRRICGNCINFHRKNRKPFGICLHKDYAHLKHTDERRHLSAYEAGYCEDHIWKSKVVAVMHTFAQFMEK